MCSRIRTVHLVIIATAGALAAGAIAFYYELVLPIQKHMAWYERVRSDLRSLADRRPASLTAGQWEYLIGWTINLHANCGSYSHIADDQAANDFTIALEAKRDGPVDASTIDWIWDQYELFTTHGREYSEKYRPSRSGEWKLAKNGCFGIEVK